jgi:hypothetical protein
MKVVSLLRGVTSRAASTATTASTTSIIYVTQLTFHLIMTGLEYLIYLPLPLQPTRQQIQAPTYLGTYSTYLIYIINVDTLRRRHMYLKYGLGRSTETVI